VGEKGGVDEPGVDARGGFDRELVLGAVGGEDADGEAEEQLKEISEGCHCCGLGGGCATRTVREEEEEVDDARRGALPRRGQSVFLLSREWSYYMPF